MLERPKKLRYDMSHEFLECPFIFKPWNILLAFNVKEAAKKFGEEQCLAAVLIDYLWYPAMAIWNLEAEFPVGRDALVMDMRNTGTDWIRLREFEVQVVEVTKEEACLRRLKLKRPPCVRLWGE